MFVALYFVCRKNVFVILSRRFKRDGGKRIAKGKRGSTGVEYSTIGETLGDLRSCQCFDHAQVCVVV